MKYLTPILCFLYVIFIWFIYELIYNVTPFHILAGGVLLLYAIYLFAIDKVLYTILKPKHIYFCLIEMLIVLIIILIKWWNGLSFIEWILFGL